MTDDLIDRGRLSRRRCCSGRSVRRQVGGVRGVLADVVDDDFEARRAKLHSLLLRSWAARADMDDVKDELKDELTRCFADAGLVPHEEELEEISEIILRGERPHVH